MFELYISSLDLTINWPLMILLGIIVGFVGGLYGVGGFLLTPLLKVIFGLSYPVAVGCSLTIVLINSILTSLGHFKKGRVRIKLALLIALSSLPGTEIGVQVNRVMNNISLDKGINILDSVLNSSFIILILFVMISSYITEKRSGSEINKSSIFSRIKYGPFINIGEKENEFISVWGLIIISFLIGIATGMLGIGGGILFFPALTYLLGISSFIAVGTTAFGRIFTTTYGSARYIIEGDFNLLIMVILFLGSFLGVQLGLRTAYFIGNEKLRKSFQLVLLSGIIVVLYDIISP